MIFFNLRGVFILLLGAAIAWLTVAFVPLATGYQFFYGLLIAALMSSLFSLATDRCDHPGLWQGYRANCIQFYYPHLGQAIPADVGLNPERRLAVFIWPLAGGPALILVFVLVYWAVDQFQQTHAVGLVDLRDYTIASLLSAVITGIFAVLTSNLRTLRQNPATSTPSNTPIEVQPETLLAHAGSAIRDGSTEQAPTRRPAYVAIVVGAIGLACNHLLADMRDQLAMLILLLCPLLVVMGTAGLIDPRIIWSIRAEGRIYPWWIRTIGGSLAVVSFAISALLMLFVYRAKL